MAITMKTGRVWALAVCVAAFIAVVGITEAQAPGSNPITITLTGQSMIRSDIRETAPKAVPVIQGLLKGDVVFTNFEGAVAEKARPPTRAGGFWLLRTHSMR